MNESVSTCVICAKRACDGMACAVCEQRMRDQLPDVVEFYALAEGELQPGSSTGERGTERSIGVRLSALDFLAGHDAVAILASWEGEWREHYGLSIQPMIARPRPLLARSVAFLRGWLSRACIDHPAIDEFARELAACWGEARSAARLAEPRSMSITCVADVERSDDEGETVVEDCGKRIPVSAVDLSNPVQCRACKTVWDVSHLMHVAISTPGAELWADPEAAAGYFRLDESTLRKWARADRIRRSHGRYELHSIHAAIHGVSDTG